MSLFLEFCKDKKNAKMKIVLIIVIYKKSIVFASKTYKFSFLEYIL